MIKGLAGTTIFSEDHTALVPFYRDVIGLEVNEESPGETVFGPPGGPWLLVASHSEIHGQSQEPARHIPSLEVDDVAAEYNRLRAKGVDFLGGPAVQQGIGFVTFRDPEGNLVNLLQFP